MVLNIQAVGQTYEQILEECTGKEEWTEYICEKEQMEYIYKKVNIQELYVQTTKHIFGMN